MAYLISKFGQRFGTQPMLAVAGEEVYFPLSFGNNWGKIRVGVLMTLTASSIPNSNTCIFGTSICSGNKGFFHPTPDDVFGSYLAPAAGTIDSAATPYALRVGNGAVMVQKRAGFANSVTNISNNAFFVCDWYQPGHQNLSAMFVDYDRVTTPGSMLQSLWIATTAANARNTWTYQNLVTYLGSTSAPGVLLRASGTNDTLVYTGTANYFDTVTFFSQQTGNATVLMAAFGVARTL